MRNKRGLWQSLGSLPTLAAVLAEWERELGDEFARAHGFLQATTAHSEEYPCTNRTPCGCVHRVVPPGKRIGMVAVCECGCAAIPVTKTNLTVFALNVVKFGESVRQAMKFLPPTSNAANGHCRRIGAAGAAQRPVFFLAPADEGALVKELAKLVAAQAGPFVLVTPTTTHHSTEVEAMQMRHGFLLLACSRWLELTKPGSFKLRARIEPVLAAFEQRIAAGQSQSKVADRISIGRLSYLPGFDQVWLGGQLYDLSERPKARACIQFLVDRKAVDRTSACHLEKEIDPHVRAKCQLPKLPNYSETKIHYYFNPTKSKTARLGRELIRSAGRGTGRYFLNVQ